MKIEISNRAFVKWSIFGCVLANDWAKCEWNDSHAFVVKFNSALNWAQIFGGNNASFVM